MLELPDFLAQPVEGQQAVGALGQRALERAHSPILRSSSS
jgi:hypothetical protein